MCVGLAKATELGEGLAIAAAALTGRESVRPTESLYTIAWTTRRWRKRTLQ
jgi:hypothetical protein